MQGGEGRLHINKPFMVRTVPAANRTAVLGRSGTPPERLACGWTPGRGRSGADRGWPSGDALRRARARVRCRSSHHEMHWRSGRGHRRQRDRHLTTVQRRSLSDGVTWQRVAGRVCLRANHSGEVARCREWMRSSASGGGYIQVTAPTCRAEIRAWHSDPGQDGL